MAFDSEGAIEKANTLQEECDILLEQFRGLVGNDVVSITSGDDLSAVLYGGTCEESIKVAVGHYKSGKRVGEVKYKNETLEHEFPRLVEPLKKTETAKNLKGQKATWGVAEEVLLKLKAKGKAKELINVILKYRGVEKLRNTYLVGWSELIKTNGWKENTIHSNLNQCVAVTGRLSSTSPNVQNANKEIKKFLRTRYEHN